MTTTSDRDFFDLSPGERECPDCGCECVFCWASQNCVLCDCCDEQADDD